MPSRQTRSTINRARVLRKTMTDGELRFWAELKTWRNAYGIHWRKQAPLGVYIADFVSHSHRLVVEVDGEFHFTDAGFARDQVRDAWMASQGYRVFRINTGELEDNFDGCVESLMRVAGLT